MNQYAPDPMLDQLIEQQQLPDHYRELVQRYLLPFSQQLATRQQARKGCYVLGVNGAQGTGKSTLCLFLKHLLETRHALTCVVLSIDDFYLSRAERQRLAEREHPLLGTRGVPGTHDIELAKTTLAALLAGEPVALPQFNKATDDLRPKAEWPLQQAVEVIIFEGWCVGAVAQPAAALEQPVNTLEAEQDRDGRWRAAINQRLGDDYQQLFALLDELLMLKAPSMEMIYQWRQLQEQKLASSVAPEEASGVMSPPQIRRFIQHYERLTRFMLQEMPVRADVVLQLDSDHRIAAVNGLLEPGAV